MLELLLRGVGIAPVFSIMIALWSSSIFLYSEILATAISAHLHFLKLSQFLCFFASSVAVPGIFLVEGFLFLKLPNLAGKSWRSHEKLHWGDFPLPYLISQG
jgi:hypothetical protein